MGSYRVKVGSVGIGAADTFRKYNRGDVFESDRDYAADLPDQVEVFHGPAPVAAHPRKAPRLQAHGKDADSMTLQELRDLAAMEEIDLGDAHTKAEVLLKVKAARATP